MFSARAAALVLLSALAAGCPASKPPATSADANKVILKGSNTLGEELAPRLIAEYKKEHPGIAFELESRNTGYGVASLLAGQCDLAGASREPIKDELELAQSRGIQLNDAVIGAYSVAVVVNSASSLSDLTKDQVRDIFTGAVQNWKDVGGPDAPIHLCVRDPISGTYYGFRELAMENKPYAAGMKTFTNYAAIVQAVGADPGSIGYCSLDLAGKSGTKPVIIQGVGPTAKAVNEGKYPYARTLHFYSNKGNESPATLEFIKFVQSPRGQEILVQMGDTPHS